MRPMRLFCRVTLTIALAVGPRLAAQVETQVPPVVPGAKPVTVEHIKIHGTALEGNLEGDAVDRDVLVFLPQSYEKDKHRHYRSSMHCTATPSGPSSGRTKSTCRKRSKAHLPRAQRK